jgi:hypothetical protein
MIAVLIRTFDFKGAQVPFEDAAGLFEGADTGALVP